MTQSEKEIRANLARETKERAVWLQQELRKYCLDRALGMFGERLDSFTAPKGSPVKLAEIFYQYVKNGKIPKEKQPKTVVRPKPFKPVSNDVRSGH